MGRRSLTGHLPRFASDDVAILNQRLRQSGFKTLDDLVRAFSNGQFNKDDLVDAFAEDFPPRLLANW